MTNKVKTLIVLVLILLIFFNFKKQELWSGLIAIEKSSSRSFTFSTVDNSNKDSVTCNG